MSISKYRVLVEVAKTNSLSQAAHLLNQTVPGISYTISKLEEEFGVPLLIRNHSKISLSTSAKRLLPHIQTILAAQNRLDQEIISIKDLSAGTLCIGTISSAARNFIPKIVKDFSTAYPGIDIKILIEGYDSLSEKIIVGAIDIAITIDPLNNNIQFFPVKNDHFLAILPKDHQYADKVRLTADDLRVQPLIVPCWENEHNLSDFIHKNNLHESVHYSIIDAATIINMVKSGLGIGFLCELFFQTHPEDVYLAPIVDCPSRTIGIAVNATVPLTVACETFLHYSLNWLQENNLTNI